MSKIKKTGITLGIKVVNGKLGMTYNFDHPNKVDLALAMSGLESLKMYLLGRFSKTFKRLK